MQVLRKTTECLSKDRRCPRGGRLPNKSQKTYRILKISGVSLKIKVNGGMKLTVKIKFSLSTKSYRGVEVRLHSFLTSALEESE